VLRQLGIGPALRWLCAQTAERDGIDVSTRIAATLPAVDDATASFVYRAARELLRNAVRHGRPRHVSLALKAGPKKALTLAVRDDGRGFKAAAAGAPAGAKGFGLFSLRERVEEAGGALAIVSAPKKGATITVTVPLPVEGKP
jgi:signal transduction histidine kinase